MKRQTDPSAKAMKTVKKNKTKNMYLNKVSFISVWKQTFSSGSAARESLTAKTYLACFLFFTLLSEHLGQMAKIERILYSHGIEPFIIFALFTRNSTNQVEL